MTRVDTIAAAPATASTATAAAGETDAEKVVRLERQVEKLQRINNALIDRVERSMDFQGNSFSLFQTAILLEKQVQERTEELQHALRNLEDTNRSLSAAKEEAETARRHLTEAIESLNEGFVLFDADDRLVLCNSKYRGFFPDMRDVIAPGIRFADFLRIAVDRDLVGVSRDEADAWIERRLAQHSRGRDTSIQPLSDGRWLQVSERAAEGLGTVCIYTDVTEIKNAEAQRREREVEEKSVQLSTTLDNVVQGVSVFDRDHRLAYWNRPFILLMGLPEGLIKKEMDVEEVLGSAYVRAAFPDTDLTDDLRKWAHSRGRTQAFRAEYRRHDGVIVEVRRNVIPGGGYVSTYTDITEQRRAAKILEDAKETLEQRVQERTAELTELNEQLQAAKAAADKANLSKTKFLAAASHDLLQPLNAARLFVSAILDSNPPKEFSRLIERIEAALRSVDELLKALFDISKLDAGVSPPEWSDFPVDVLQRALTGEFAVLAERKNLTLNVVPCHVVIHSDMLLLRRILQNFLSNAIRYTRHGKVLLGCRRKADSLVIQIWDTGPGIPEHLQEEVFEEFKRFEPPEDETDSGFGLGLTIAQRSAKLLDHPLDLRSDLGRGSMFSVEVPLGQMNTAELAEIAPALHQNYGLGNAKVVLMENDDNNLEGMTALLARWSCEVLPAHDAEEACRVIAERGVEPDLIVADYHLDGGLIGLDAIAEVRQHCGRPVPGIVITADHTRAVQEATRAACYELLQKPIKPAELRSLMAHLLA